MKRARRFLHIARDEALKVLNILEFDDHVDDFEIQTGHFRDYFEPWKISHMKHLRSQGITEPTDAYSDSPAVLGGVACLQVGLTKIIHKLDNKSEIKIQNPVIHAPQKAL